MAFDFMKIFGGSQAKETETGTRKLVVHTRSCPQNHPCPSVRVCPVGALTQKGYAAPTIDYSKCTSCGKCSRYCFPGALVMEKR
ncbi:MAG: 4Fe-4S ferredoxin [Spirochaetae bacterium HGW-Spirochaetae-8]|jgi:Fe-S-cluster-containing hydrogenase component 2|nr:MAG: 4Fe-4S ferredoxin [Spirochaetae bacterium HGW-Spirochaetae-8]